MAGFDSTTAFWYDMQVFGYYMIKALASAETGDESNVNGPAVGAHRRPAPDTERKDPRGVEDE